MHISFSTFVAVAAFASTSLVLAQNTTPTGPTESKEAFDKATVSVPYIF